MEEEPVIYWEKGENRNKSNKLKRYRERDKQRKEDKKRKI